MGISVAQTQNDFILSYFLFDFSGENNSNDAVNQVTDMLISNFLDITSCDNNEIAKFYLEKNEMDIEKALVDYYDNMP